MAFYDLNVHEFMLHIIWLFIGIQKVIERKSFDLILKDRFSLYSIPLPLKNIQNTI